MKAKFGDVVRYAFDGYASVGTVIGRIAEYPEITCVATETTIGMTMWEEHVCAVIRQDLVGARHYRRRYEARCPDFLHPDDLDR